MSKKTYVLSGIFLSIVIVTLAVLYIVKNNKQSYIITFDTDGGNAVFEQSIEKGEKVLKPTDPTKEGFVFDNWYVDDEIFDFETKITSNMIIVAKWNKSGTVYKVSFDTDGGNDIDAQTVLRGDKVVEPKNKPTKKGYDFVEWQIDGKKYDFNSEVNANIVIKASWKENKELVNLTRYTVSFDANGGSSVSKTSVVEGNTVARPTNPTRSGYTFVEWQLNGKSYSFSSKVTGNIVLKAVWRERTKVMVSFNSDGGSTIDARNVYVGDKLGSLSNPTKNGYTFDGWYVGETKYTSDTVISVAITLKAKWIDNNVMALNAAKSGVKPFTITQGGQTLTYSPSGCTSVITPAESITKITRGVTDRNINISVVITCGSESDTVITTGVIKASTYKYTLTDAENNTNYYVRVGNLTDFVIYKSGTGIVLGPYQPAHTAAVISKQNIESHPNVDMTLNSDPNTVYVVTFAG